MQAPVIIWNLANGFSSFEFHLSTRHDDDWLQEINWRSFWDFPGASAFLISPFLIPVFWRFFMRRHQTRFEEVAKGLAIWVFWLSTGTFILVSLFDWVFWWWNLVAYILVMRSEEHTSELQSRENLVCRLLLEKKNKHN